ncbi:MAG: sensor domain-containing protein, partial [Nocardioidaceae bacterium]
MSGAAAGSGAGEDLLGLPAVEALLGEVAPAIVGVIGPGLTVLAAGGAMLRQVGYTPETLIGQQVDRITPDPMVRHRIEQALGGQASRVTSTINGRLWHIAAEPLAIRDGTTVAVCVLSFEDTVQIGRDLAAHALELEKFAALVELSADFIGMADLDGRVTYVNRAGRRLVGLAPEADLATMTVADFVSAGAHRGLGEEMRAVQEHGHWEGESELRQLATGETIPVSGNSFLVRSAAGAPLAVATVRHDLRTRIAVERRLADRVQEQRTLAELGRLALTRAFPDLLDAAVALIASRYPSLACSVSRCTDDGTSAQIIASSLPRHDSAVIPVDGTSLAGAAVREDRTVASDDVLADVDHGRFTATASFGVRAAAVSPIPGTAGPWGTVSVSDRAPRHWTEDDLALIESVATTLGAAVRRFELEGKLQHQALHDHLTGLPNRALLQDRIEQALARSARHGGRLAVLLLDLDDFKTINDSLGHGAGDELLAEVAARLRDAVRAGDTVGRLGGDEFVVLCEDLDGDEEVAFVAERILQACLPPAQVTGRRVNVTVSIGVALSNQGSQGEKSTADLLSEADIAMYRAKRDRPGSYRVFDEAMRGEVLGRLNIAGELRTALRDGALDVAYQPVVDLRTGRVEAMEALARWTTLTGEAVGPDVFIPVAEETGLIGELDRFVLTRAARDARQWQQHGPVAVRVNVSAHELRASTFAAGVLDTLAAAGLDPTLLCLELTESLLVAEEQVTLDNLARLREAGISLQLDDFGTGY